MDFGLGAHVDLTEAHNSWVCHVPAVPGKISLLIVGIRTASVCKKPIGSWTEGTLCVPPRVGIVRTQGGT
jgi:hypothetical protein